MAILTYTPDRPPSLSNLDTPLKINSIDVSAKKNLDFFFFYSFLEVDLTLYLPQVLLS